MRSPFINHYSTTQNTKTSVVLASASDTKLGDCHLSASHEEMNTVPRIIRTKNSLICYRFQHNEETDAAKTLGIHTVRKTLINNSCYELYQTAFLLIG